MPLGDETWRVKTTTAGESYREWAMGDGSILLVFLHPWSAGSDNVLNKAELRTIPNVVIVAPNSGGAAGGAGSPSQLAALKSVIDEAKAEWDSEVVLLTGASGGGYSGLMLLGTYPGIAQGASLWVGITDLAWWYAEGSAAGGDQASLVSSLGGTPTTEAMKGRYYDRSPISRLQAISDCTISLHAGMLDNKVPPYHQQVAAAFLRNRSGVRVKLTEWPSMGHSDNWPFAAEELKEMAYGVLKAPVTIDTGGGGGGGGGEPPPGDTILLLHCDGTDASTAFPDATETYTVTANGSAQVATAQSVFGGASLRLPGSGSYLSIPDSPAWTLGNAVTLEMWLRLDSVTGRPELIGQRQNGANYWMMYIDFTGGAGLRFAVRSGDATIIDLYQSGTAGWAADTWYHVAMVKNGNDYQISRDGIVLATVTDTSAFPDLTGQLEIGGNVGADDFLSHNPTGYMDEIRIKAAAEYSGNFTVPTAPFSGN